MKLNGLYVVGGQQRSARPLRAGSNNWYKYQKGLILEVGIPSHEVQVSLEYASPAHVCAAEDPAILFKCGTVSGDRLYVCTQTEVLIYRLPDLLQVGYVSLPRFNDVHHVRPTPNGTLLVVNTGLDMLVEISCSGEIVREWSVSDENPWDRFSPDVDYRTVASTKPYKSHPNNVFYVGPEIWVTRFEQRDAICLTDPTKRIEIGFERVHDGFVDGDWIYFSTVDGKIVIVCKSTLRVEEVFDLNEFSPPGVLLGWCRGLFIEDGKVWVGFSRLRPTKFRENVSWVTKGFKKILPTRIACYDLTDRSCVARVDVEPFGLDAVFSVLPAYN